MGARTNTRRQHKQRIEFRAECEANDELCWICGLPIDYDAAHDDYANDDRFQEDHYWPVSTHPHLQDDPDNKRASHAGCNRERGNGAPVVDLGIPSRQWA
ncbi:hypothetical protein JNB62_05435 [Microbacterium jejuense]|uniref:HNH endonuclease n=1 Tax=Microbacterium jejuense TaxID=1263637 RepID=A0ABS7HK97_9MICO|nr:hypothetical protein [Microbacterium jejuense]MBW9093118.1 hypothetical protein [Microbacterium jejuense]